jgi:hypothetical protein
MIKDFKLEILICFNSPITKHWTPLHQTPQIFPHSFTKLSKFSSLRSTGRSAIFSLGFRSRGTICEDLTSVQFLSVRLPAYLPYILFVANRIWDFLDLGELPPVSSRLRDPIAENSTTFFYCGIFPFWTPNSWAW